MKMPPVRKGSPVSYGRNICHPSRRQNAANEAGRGGRLGEAWRASLSG